MLNRREFTLNLMRADDGLLSKGIVNRSLTRLTDHGS